MSKHVVAFLLMQMSVLALRSQTANTRAAEIHDTLAQYCLKCHNNSVRSGGLALDGLDTTRLAERAETWER